MLPLNQGYMPKEICWNAKTVQNATLFRSIITAFMRRHPSCRLYSGYRTGDTVEESDHLCGLADDIVPLTQDAAGLQALQDAEADAITLGVAFTQIEWTDINKHLHVSWARCPKSLGGPE